MVEGKPSTCFRLVFTLPFQQCKYDPLLDGLINTLLLSLGIDLNKVDVGANLSCHSGRATLVI